ncbi:MAG: hypothetical protein GVY19_01610 [Bacteroidetes bacterium]|jgi:hypothetical protein|nr:hypothetical protein [Bacteroidota bacterium]
MKTTARLNIVLSILALFFLSVSAFAQPGGFYEHGSNSGGVDANENIDSVTVGASMRYVVAPDPTANPSYDFSTMSGTLESTFTWTVDAALGTIAGAPDTDNDVTVDMESAPATGQISVQEVSSAGCASGDVTNIDVEIIAAPTAAITPATGDTCTDDPTAIALDVPISLTTSVADGNVRINVNIDGPSNADIYDNDFDLTAADTEFTIPAGTFNDGLGDYDITIEEVSDRISRKSSVTVNPNDVLVFTINRVPNTGVIYHLPNK